MENNNLGREFLNAVDQAIGVDYQANRRYPQEGNTRGVPVHPPLRNYVTVNINASGGSQQQRYNSQPSTSGFQSSQNQFQNPGPFNQQQLYPTGMMPQNQPIAGKATNALQPLRPLQPGSFYRMKMKELLGKIQALSGNKYLHQDPEQIAYIQYGLSNTGDAAKMYNRCCLTKIENLTKHLNALQYITNSRRRFDLLEDFERDSFETLVKDLDKRHFHSSPYNCEVGGVFNYHGDLDYTERAYRMIRDFEDTMQQFNTQSQVKKLKDQIARENARIDEDERKHLEEQNIKRWRDLKQCEEILKIASNCDHEKQDSNCWLKECAEMKFFIKHSKECQISECSMCNGFFGLCTYHAKNCENGTTCKTVYCKEIKERIYEEELEVAEEIAGILQ